MNNCYHGYILDVDNFPIYVRIFININTVVLGFFLSIRLQHEETEYKQNRDLTPGFPFKPETKQAVHRTNSGTLLFSAQFCLYLFTYSYLWFHLESILAQMHLFMDPNG
jgi:hypothetical protein